MLLLAAIPPSVCVRVCVWQPMHAFRQPELNKQRNQTFREIFHLQTSRSGARCGNEFNFVGSFQLALFV